MFRLFINFNLYGALVHITKLGLIFGIVAMGGFLLVLPFWQANQDKIALARILAGDTSFNQPVHNPRISERIEGYQFDMLAKSAIPLSSDWARVKVLDVEGEVTDANNNKLFMTAKEAIYDSKKRLAELKQNVTFTDLESSYRLRTESATLDLETQVARGSSDVKIQGERMEVTGQGFEILDQGQRFLILGNARLELQQP